MSFYFVVALVANKGIIIIMHTDDRYQSVVSLKKTSTTLYSVHSERDATAFRLHCEVVTAAARRSLDVC